VAPAILDSTRQSDTKALLKLAIPASLAIASDPLLNIADTAMIGHLGVVPLAAKAIATGLIGAVSWIFAFLIFGTTSLVASQHGSRNFSICGELLQHALFLGLTGGLLVAALCFTFATELYELMGAGPDVMSAGVPYFRIRCIIIPILFSIYACVGFLRGLQDTRTPMFVAFLVSGTNIVLDYGLIYGKLGLPALGLRGAAIAALISQALGIAVYLRLLFFTNRATQYRLRNWRLNMQRFRSLSRIARDLAARTAALRLSLVFATAIVSRMGPVYLAAYEIIFQLFIFCSDTIDGLAVAGQALAARHLGANQPQRASGLGWTLVVWGCLSGAVFGVAYLALQDPLLALFTTSRDVTALITTQAFLLLVIFQPLNGIVFTLDGFLLGAHDTRFLMWAMLAGGLLLFVPITSLSFYFDLGLFGVWGGFSLFMIHRLGANLWRLSSQRWVTAYAKAQRSERDYRG